MFDFRFSRTFFYGDDLGIVQWIYSLNYAERLTISRHVMSTRFIYCTDVSRYRRLK